MLLLWKQKWATACEDVPSGLMWTEQALVRLHNCAVWSVPSLSTYRCTGWSGALLFWYVLRTRFLVANIYVYNYFSTKTVMQPWLQNIWVMTLERGSLGHTCPMMAKIILNIHIGGEGGCGRVWGRCLVSYVTRASNWYYLTLGQGLLSL